MKCKVERQRKAVAKKRRSITSKFRRGVFRKRAVAPCRYCGQLLTRETATGDHVHPVSKGGANTMRNMALACGKCNSLKSSMEVGAFMRLIGGNGRSRGVR